MPISRTLAQFKLWYDYLNQRTQFATLLALQKRYAGEISREDLWHHCLKNAVVGKMTYSYQNKCLEMEPTISAQDTLFVRKLPYLNANCMQPKSRFLPSLRRFEEQIHVGDVVVLNDPLNSDNHIVRRLAALSGYEMTSTNKEDEPFVLADDQCWVLSDNQKLEPGKSNDSRTFGPVPVTNIVGRVICRFQARDQCHFMQNSKVSMRSDLPIFYIELEEYEVILRHKDEESKG